MPLLRLSAQKSGAAMGLLGKTLFTPRIEHSHSPFLLSEEAKGMTPQITLDQAIWHVQGVLR